MNFYKKFIAYILAIALLTLSLAGCSGKGSDDAGSNGPQQGSGGKTPPAFEMENYSLTPAENYDELARLLAGVINGDAYSSAENVGVVDEFFASGDRPSYAGNYGEQSNDTRQLPEGVSQADAAVLANGYLYQVQDGELTILQAQGADTAVVSSTGVTADPAGYDNYEETAQAVAVSGDLAAVMTYVYAWNTVAGENGEWSSETVSQTHVKLYDVQDKAAPVAVADFVQDGSYRAAYLANDTLYLLTDDYVINLDEQDSASFIPTCGAAGQTAQLPAEKILVNDQVDAPVYTVLSAISMQNGAATDTLAVTGQMQPCFAAADKIYLAGWCYAMQQSEQYKENQYQVTDYYSHAITLIASLHCTDGLRLEKTACVNGRLPEASSLDYDGGYLRLGTMAESYTNRLFEDDSMGFSCGVRGPVSVHQASSLSPVEIESLQITKSVNGEKKETGENRASDTRGMKHFVRFGLYEIKGSINVQLAEKTGFSEEDADTVKECLRTLFVNDASSARPDGSMEVVKLFWWRHNCKDGQYSSAKVHRSVKVALRDADTIPTAAGDYVISLEPLPGLEPEVIDGV